DGGRHHTERGTFRGRNRALHHDPDRDTNGWATKPQDDPDDFTLRTLRPEAAIQLRVHLRAGAPAGAESSFATASVAERRAAANIASQSYRRNLPLSSGWPAALTRAP